jgi:hypothetical protein
MTLYQILKHRNGAIAWATSCVSDQYKRPILGVANFGPSYILTTEDPRKLIAVAIHEIMHALGFSESSFQHYTQLNGKPHSRIIEEVSLHGEQVKLMVTPEVTKQVKQHFSCYPSENDPHSQLVGLVNNQYKIDSFIFCLSNFNFFIKM